MFRMQTTLPRDEGVRYQRWVMVRGVLLALPGALAIWAAIYWLVPPMAGLEESAARVAFAWRCVCVVVMLSFLPAIEAVAHKRFGASDVDLVTGHSSRRFEVRFLQHTMEQLLLFIPSLLGLATYCDDGGEMRSVLAAATVWIVSRWMFRIGYEQGARVRGAGLVGMVQSVLILMYVSARFGYDIAGWLGAIAPLVLVFGIEGYIIASRGRLFGQGKAT